MRKQIFIVGSGSYPFDIVVSIGSTTEEIIKYIESKKKYKLSEREKEHLGAKGRGRAVRLENNAMVLWVKIQKDPVSFYSTLLHEVFHIVEFTLDTAGIRHCDQSSEAFAYQLDCVIEQILKKILK